MDDAGASTLDEESFNYSSTFSSERFGHSKWFFAGCSVWLKVLHAMYGLQTARGSAQTQFAKKLIT